MDRRGLCEPVKWQGAKRRIAGPNQEPAARSHSAANFEKGPVAAVVEANHSAALVPCQVGSVHFQAGRDKGQSLVVLPAGRAILFRSQAGRYNGLSAKQ